MSNISSPRDLPAWVPEIAARYLDHTEGGHSIRALARVSGCHASTILRQIRKLEARRDDMLVDEALRILGRDRIPVVCTDENSTTEAGLMSVPSHPDQWPEDETALAQKARHALESLVAPGAVLAVATDMDKAVVVRDLPGGSSKRTAVVDRAVAQAMALRDWIACQTPGRISRYVITAAGRSALSRILAGAENAARAEREAGFAEAPAGFTGHPGSARRNRYATADSPVLALSRRRDKDGAPFLPDDLLRAAEQLREDFELAQLGPRITQNWDRFLTGAGTGSGAAAASEAGMATGPAAARSRVQSALHDLGPGLADIALRCCCYLEGLEHVEKQMGWSARSGKIVLRIALQRLRHYYAGLPGAHHMIG